MGFNAYHNEHSKKHRSKDKHTPVSSKASHAAKIVKVGSSNKKTGRRAMNARSC